MTEKDIERLTAELEQMIAETARVKKELDVMHAEAKAYIAQAEEMLKSAQLLSSQFPKKRSWWRWLWPD